MEAKIQLPIEPLRELWRADFAEILKQQTTEPEQPKQPEQPEYKTRKQIREEFQICDATLWRWQKIGVLQGYRIGSRVLFKTIEVEAALKGIPNLKWRRAK